jgi:2-desacetyl-2-hydroxyethyl bacteriochlorophyllide A dehydrogenase
VRALTVTAPGEIVLADIPEPPPATAQQAVVAVEWAGVCGTDLGVAFGAVPVDYPRILGHELLGTIVEAATNGELAAGTRVLVDPAVSCGRCRQCQQGRSNLCPRGELMGRGVEGGFAERILVDEARLHAVPTEIDPRQAVLAQVLGTCVHAQRRFSVFPGQSAAVIGLGVSGLLTIQLLRERGIDRIVGITRSARNRELGEALGATVTAHPDDAEQVVADLTDGEGVDVVVECAGKLATVAQAIELVGLGGTIAQFGILTETEGRLPFYQLYRKEIRIENARAALPDDYATAVDLVASGRVEVEPLLTDTAPLAQGAEVLTRAHTESGLLKLLLEVA